jgi:hypothetical protein
MSAVVKETPSSLSTLTAQWLKAKKDELDAVLARRKIDEQIVALMPKKDEGSVSQDVGFFHVSVTYGINRKVDSKRLDVDWESLPATVQAAFRVSYDVAAKEYKALSGKDLDAAIAYVESKPASASVKVEIIDPAKKG